MSTPTPQSNSAHTFIDARLIQVRLVSTQLTTPPARPSKNPQQVQIKIETSSGFSVALDDPVSPKELLIEIEYKVDLKIDGTGKQIAEYQAKHAGQFSVVAWSGFPDWTNPPTEAMAPYLAILHATALRRAEDTLGETGLRGVALPRVDNFDMPDNGTKALTPVATTV